MSASTNAILGVLFLVLSVVTTALMYQFWGYPFDKQERKSSCPQWKMNIHRGCGYAYIALYIVLMVQMVPRLWTYQVEFPARTVAHIMLGITIGVILLVKVSIMRFWRHFEEWMPVLGTLLMLCTFLLTGLSLPFALQERSLAARAPGGSAFSDQSQARVARLLPLAGLPEDAAIDSLATELSLREGRGVLMKKCVSCHDLKTVISKPRTPADWYRTALRMAGKPTLGPALEPHDLLHVTAFLVAITPDLKQSLAQKRSSRAHREELLEGALPPADSNPQSTPAAYDLVGTRATFERVCSQCHETEDVEFEPPTSSEEVTSLVDRMIENGLEAEPQDLAAVRWYLTQTYVKSE